MKVLAMHLPQYHIIPENDQWWGKDFTDWVNVKKAKPLYKWHNQPVVPLNGNYYDMMNINTLKDQAELAKKYNVYGFCYYHYWFNGKLLLEKPCELLLKHPEIENNYCFCWANETWARTWDGKDTDILIEQTFGGEEDWKAHIDYLLSYFMDPRYIKINGRPVMFFYSCIRIEKFNKMIEFWNKEIRKKGIPDIYVAEFVNSFNNGKNNINSDVLVEFQPHCAARYSISNFVKAKRVICKKFGYTDILSYDYIWRQIINNKEVYGGKRLWRSGFVGFDNTPRKGKQGMVVRGTTPEKFYKYLLKLINCKNRNYADDFIVINAWNEWAEGAVLEPTEENKYRYLNAVKKAIESNKNL